MEGFDSTDESTRIAVAIEPLLYCKLVVSLLESVPGFRVVARLTAWRDVASLSRMNGASILVVRLQEGDHHARGLLQCAISLCPDVRTIALVSGCTPRSARALLKLAVQGIVDEGSEDGDIAEAVRVVRSGRAYLCPTAATAIARHVSDAVADESCDEIGERGGGGERGGCATALRGPPGHRGAGRGRGGGGGGGGGGERRSSSHRIALLAREAGAAPAGTRCHSF